MGHDVLAIANHAINTASIVTTAIDIANYLNTTIEFGHRDDWIIKYNNRNIKGLFEFIPIGKIIKPENEGLQLYDNYYNDKLYHPEQYDPKKKYYGLIESYRISNLEKYTYIGREVFTSDTRFDGRWWDFLEYFNLQKVRYNDILGYRKSVLLQVMQLGGSEAFYIDDQGPSEILEQMTETYSWQQIKEKAFTDFASEMLHVSHWAQHREEYTSVIDYKVFYDDFADLKEEWKIET